MPSDLFPMALVVLPSIFYAVLDSDSTVSQLEFVGSLKIIPSILFFSVCLQV